MGIMNPLSSRWWAGLPPAAGAVVMATGIISVGLELLGHHALSLAALVLTAAVWLLLAADFAVRLVRDRSGWTALSRTPASLTAVAATCVLGTRLSLFGRQHVAAVLLALAAVAWPVLLYTVMRHWHRPMPGPAFLVCVATQGLAVLAGTLVLAGRGDWLGRAALVLFCLGLLLYLEALARFDPRQVWLGAGDQWIAAGALAISALAGSRLVASTLWSSTVHTVLRDATLVLLTLDLGAYAVLLAAELLRPRPRYDVRRWSTVFPLGMTAVAVLSTASAAHVARLHTVGEVLLWVAVAAWLLTAGALLATGVRQEHP
ncbi:tellurite resistance/C4-dicarboxylate transporter family protein [Kitasatospora sp. NPDC059571]|uniref:tellurite resistance/C4-dicarboxylate transporter family protein n=1 Tax=Kitasatospora sp. NPDC059571 TaxID=3346871 RepID=UPI0036974C18